MTKNTLVSVAMTPVEPPGRPGSGRRSVAEEKVIGLGFRCHARILDWFEPAVVCFSSRVAAACLGCGRCVGDLDVPEAKIATAM